MAAPNESLYVMRDVAVLLSRHRTDSKYHEDRVHIVEEEILTLVLKLCEAKENEKMMNSVLSSELGNTVTNAYLARETYEPIQVTLPPMRNTPPSLVIHPDPPLTCLVTKDDDTVKQISIRNDVLTLSSPKLPESVQKGDDLLEDDLLEDEELDADEDDAVEDTEDTEQDEEDEVEDEEGTVEEVDEEHKVDDKVVVSAVVSEDAAKTAEEEEADAVDADAEEPEADEEADADAEEPEADEVDADAEEPDTEEPEADKVDADADAEENMEVVDIKIGRKTKKCFHDTISSKVYIYISDEEAGDCLGKYVNGKIIPLQ